MKLLYCLVLFAILVASCSSEPSENAIQTAVAATVAAQPTSTPIPTNTPLPTNTPILTTTPTLVPPPTNTLAPEPSCSEEWHLVDIVPASGKGVFVTSTCSDTVPHNLIGINLIIPTGTPDTMVDDGFQYVRIVASMWGWDLDDIDTIFQLKAKECTAEFVTSGEIIGFCMVVGQESKIYSWTNLK